MLLVSFVPYQQTKRLDMQKIKIGDSIWFSSVSNIDAT